MSKLGWMCVMALVLAGMACGEDKQEPEKNKCEVQVDRATNECMAQVPMLGDPAMCTGQTLCIAECAEAATCESIRAFTPLLGCVLNCANTSDGGPENPLCDQQLSRAQNECGLGAGDGGTQADAGIEIPCNGIPLCIAMCSQAATCAEIQDGTANGTGPYATCQNNCINGGSQ